MATSLGIPISDLSPICAIDYCSPGHDVNSAVMSGAGAHGSHGGITTCPVCGKRVQITYLALHLKRTHDSIEATCPVCDKRFKNKHSLGVHQARYHPRHLMPQQSPQFASMQSNLINNFSLVNSDLLLQQQQQLQDIYNSATSISSPVSSEQGQRNLPLISSTSQLNGSGWPYSPATQSHSELTVDLSSKSPDVKHFDFAAS